MRATTNARGLWLALLCTACGVADVPPVPRFDGGFAQDTDHDWACDDTERAFGSDPDVADSDGDRLLDGVELRYGLDPLLDTDPGAGRVVFLEAAPGATSEVEVHELVDGSGEAFSGELDAWQALEASWPVADHYLVSAVASSADPPDHVFGFPDNGDRIESVVGQTRLGFRLRFAFAQDEPRDCAQAVPFVYAIKRQDGVRFGDRVRVLLIAPDTAEPTWCDPRSCF